MQTSSKPTAVPEVRGSHDVRRSAAGRGWVIVDSGGPVSEFHHQLILLVVVVFLTSTLLDVIFILFSRLLIISD